MIKVAILGGSGYTALELIKILLRHPGVEIVAVTSRQEGTPLVAEQHPSLNGRMALRWSRSTSIGSRRAACSALRLFAARRQHGAALPALLDRGMRVIDLSADYRLRDPNVYAQWYGESHHDLAHLAQAVYGLPEIYGDEIHDAQLDRQPRLLSADRPSSAWRRWWRASTST